MISPRTILALAVLAACWLGAGAARASGDFSCATVWKLEQTTYADCNNLPFLSPGNDSRVNLQLLLLDAGRAELEAPPRTDPPTPPIAQSASPFTWEAFSELIGPRSPGTAPVQADGGSDYANGEGSRCRSNAAGAKAFEAALDASPALPAAERLILASAREALPPGCKDAETAPAAFTPPPSIRSPLGRQFGRYLAGSADFYGGDFDDARRNFAAAAESRQPWLKETALYMLGRAALNQAQFGAFDEFGALAKDKIDAAALGDAERAFQAYLKTYPDGLYAASARGLLRRIAWLGGQPGKLAVLYHTAFAAYRPGARNVSVGELVLEADNKLLTQVGPAEVSDPLLLATLDLMAMRKAAPKPLSYEALSAQKAAFAGAPSLFGYLLAAHRFYVEGDPAGALSQLGPDPAPAPMDALAFSRQVLRGEALEAQKNRAGARRLWLEMIGRAKAAFQRPMLDLALAWNLEHDGRLGEVFAAGSPVHDSEVRAILLRYGAGPGLLAQRIGAPDAADPERRLARFVLLYKDLMRGRYGAFGQDVALSAPKAPPPPSSDDSAAREPDQSLFDWPGATAGFGCEDLRRIADALASDPRRPHALLCLGEFVRLNGLDGNPLDSPPKDGELGSAPSLFTGPVFSRQTGYQTIIADPRAPGPERAYALYRAVRCYAPSGNNGCGGSDAPSTERARWFHLLKTNYADTPWARALKYYW